MAIRLRLKHVQARVTIISSTAAMFLASGCGSEDQSFPAVTIGKKGSNPLDVVNYQRKAETLIEQPLIPFAGTYAKFAGADPVRMIVAEYGRILSVGGLSAASGMVMNLNTVDDLIPPALAAQGFSWKETAHTASPEGFESSRMQLHYQGVPVNSTFALTHSEPNQGNAPVWLRSSVPESFFQDANNAALEAPVSVGEFFYSPAYLIEKYASEQGYSPDVVSATESDRTYYLLGKKLHAALRLTVASDPLGIKPSPAVPLDAFVDAETGQLLEQSPKAFHVDGYARTFRENSVASSSEGLIDVRLPTLDNAGERLSSPIFQVENCSLQAVSEACTFKASAPGGDFRSISSTSDSYDELVAYYSISRAMAWYRSLMGTTPGSFQTENSWGAQRQNFGLGADRIGKLSVYVRAQTRTPNSGQTLDNAVYLPSGSSGGNSPEILIGTGWEAAMLGTPPRALRYIGKDSDVSMHEFGHHIVFRTINQIKGQALGMHEGFADYFTYAITGNNLLAESVVAGAPSLRAGDREGTLADYPPTSATPPHTAGEFWSTVLWDTRVSLGSWQGGFSKFDKIVYHALDLMQPNETYYGAINALARSADIFALSTGDDAVALKEKIFAQFYKRGFIERPTGSGTVPPASALLLTSTPSAGLANEAKTSASQSSSAGRSKKSFLGISCTVGTDPRGTTHADLGTLMLLLSMLCLPLLRLRYQSAAPKRLAIRRTSDTMNRNQEHNSNKT
jgi:hypothetical protein